MKITMSSTVDAPLERVFEVYTDIENAAGRIEGIKKLEILSETRSGLGLKWRETREFMGKEAVEEMEITGIDPPDSYKVEAESHGTHYTSIFTFKEQTGATTVAWEFAGEPLTLVSKVMSVMAVLFSGSLKKMMQGDLDDLKKYIETAQ